MLSKARVMALASGDVWLKSGAKVLMFGPSDRQEPSIGSARPRPSQEWLACAVTRTADLASGCKWRAASEGSYKLSCVTKDPISQLVDTMWTPRRKRERPRCGGPLIEI
jgi:hypothetical protein